MTSTTCGAQISTNSVVASSMTGVDESRSMPRRATSACASAKVQDASAPRTVRAGRRLAKSSPVAKTTVAPAEVDAGTEARAKAIATAVLEGLDYVGVLGVELFDLGEGRLLVNEIAPRVHNTGHWTQDGCVCDQFEQHIRAIAGWPLGPTAAHARVEMTNLLGDEVEQWTTLAAEPDARLHLYGKAEARAGRKMGHVNRVKPLG